MVWFGEWNEKVSRIGTHGEQSSGLSKTERSVLVNMTEVASSPVSCVGISPDAQVVVAACGDQLKVFPVAGKHFNGKTSVFEMPPESCCCKRADGSLSSLCFPGQSTVYAATSSGSFSRYSVRHAVEPVHEYTVSDPHGRAGEVTGIASVGPESIVVTSGKDGIIRCWDPETRQSVARLSGHKYEVRAVAVAESTAEGETVNIIASAGRDKTVRLWDVRVSESNPIHVFSGHSGWVHDVAISAGGASRADPVVISCAGDKTVRVWNLAMMKEELILSGHEYRVWSVAVASDGSYALSGSTDATVRAWNLLPNVSQEERGIILEGHRDSVLSVSVARNGAVSASGCEDGSVYIWNTSSLFGRKAADDAGDIALMEEPTSTAYSHGTELPRAHAIEFAGEQNSESGLYHGIARNIEQDPGAQYGAQLEMDAQVSEAALQTTETSVSNFAATSGMGSNSAIATRTVESVTEAPAPFAVAGIGNDLDYIQEEPTFNSNADVSPSNRTNGAPSGCNASNKVVAASVVCDVMDSIIEKAISMPLTEVSLSSRTVDAPSPSSIANKDAQIEALTKQLRAADNLAIAANAQALAANAQALEASLIFAQDAQVPFNAHRQPGDEGAKCLRDINDRLRRLSARLDVLVG
jgi:WD40 repeat protein